MGLKLEAALFLEMLLFWSETQYHIANELAECFMTKFMAEVHSSDDVGKLFCTSHNLEYMQIFNSRN